MAIVTIIMGIYLGNRTLSAAGNATLIQAMKVSFIVFVILSIIATLMSAKRSK
jgi:hypothetical protein